MSEFDTDLGRETAEAERASRETDPPTEPKRKGGWPKGKPRTGQRKSGAGITNLQSAIKDAMMTAAVIGSIKEPNLIVAVEATVDEFAAGWAAVAAQSPQARAIIEGLLIGGVWFQAITATIVLVVTCAAVTRKLPPPLYPMGAYCLGRAGIEIVPDVPPPPAPEEPA